MAFNIKDPFRLQFFTNKVYTLLLVLSFGVNVWFLLDDSNVIGRTFQLVNVPMSYRLHMLLLFLGQFVLCMIWEVIATRIIPKLFAVS